MVLLDPLTARITRIVLVFLLLLVMVLVLAALVYADVHDDVSYGSLSLFCVLTFIANPVIFAIYVLAELYKNDASSAT